LITKLFISIVFALFIISFLSMYAQNSGQRGWREGEKQIRISNVTPEIAIQLYKIKLNMDFCRSDHNHIIAYVVPDELLRIEALRIPYVVEIENLNEYNTDFWFREDQYHSYQGIIDLADSLALNFPSICKKIIFGYSIQNRQCAALKISDNVDVDEPEAEVMFDGGIHGDEIGGSENVIRFARDLCTKYGIDPTITNLINNREIWLYLMVNPDGRYNMSRYNANSVDLNRDWGYMWDQWGGSPASFSQVETRFLRDCMYNNQFVVHTTYHSGTEIISYPWSYRPNPSPDQNHINQLAGIYSSVSGYSNLPYGQGYNVMYPINGSTKDGNYGLMGSVSWSIEISNSKQPPTSQIMQYYNWNYPSMLALIEYAGYGIEGTVTDAVTNSPIPAVIFVNNYYPAYTDPVIGDYHKYVLPGSYSITVWANGYQSQSVSNVLVTANNSTTINFQLTPEPGHYVYKFSASQIPDNNFSDEGSTPAVIGKPDDINYSIGKGGWCVLDMQYPVANVSGADFIIHEGDTSPEGYFCYVGSGIDGPWYLVGSGNSTTSFDISSSGLQEAQFIKIVDDGDGVAIQANAGFDLDAIEAIDIVPVELVSFTAENVLNDVILKWQTATETNNRGFDIERSQKSGVGSQNDWEKISFVEGSGTTTELTDYNFTDKIINPGTYDYRLKQLDFDGTYTYSEEVEVEISGPKDFTLFQNYPNPFNPATTIKFALPVNTKLVISIYNLLGEKISEVFNGEIEEGYHEFEFNAVNIPSGVYFYRFESQQFNAVKKMVLLR
jgi:hypothetical protein